METTNEAAVKAIKNLGIEKLNEMQEATAKAFWAQDDLVLLSPTGSGKTLAFLLPLIERLHKGEHGVQAIILTPTRELALQTEDVFRRMQTGFRICACYGGHPIKTEIQNLQEPPAVVVGTPGRLDDLLKRRALDLRATEILILDEFDKSLDLGFHEEMRYIIGWMRMLRKRILTSATVGMVVPDFVGLDSPGFLDFTVENEPSEKLSLKFVASQEKDKLPVLLQLLCNLGDGSSIVFVNHREAAERVSDFLKENGIANALYHGGLEQDDRERALCRFRNGSSRILVSTDLASRGLDIPEIESIIHYHLPLDEDAFIHRNGRTARMFAKGAAYVIVSPDERKPHFINQTSDWEKLADGRPLPPLPHWETLFIGKGRKDKISRADILGFLTQQGGLQKDEVGLIEVKDFWAYVAVNRQKAKKTLETVKNLKIKNIKAKIELAR